jgi:hypothetical protein
VEALIPLLAPAMYADGYTGKMMAVQYATGLAKKLF